MQVLSRSSKEQSHHNALPVGFQIPSRLQEQGPPFCSSIFFKVIRASLVAQAVKNLPAMWETGVRSLGWEDPLENGMATHSSILAWRSP